MGIPKGHYNSTGTATNDANKCGEAPLQEAGSAWIDSAIDLDLTTGKNSLEFQALRGAPRSETIDEFEGKSFRDRQIILTRLRMLERTTNVKTLPVANGMFTLAVGAFLGWAIRDPTSSTFAVLPIYCSILAGIFAIVLVAIRKHILNETCLTAWIEVFQDSHSAKTKEEDKAKENIAKATLALEDLSS